MQSGLPIGKARSQNARNRPVRSKSAQTRPHSMTAVQAVALAVAVVARCRRVVRSGGRGQSSVYYGRGGLVGGSEAAAPSSSTSSERWAWGVTVSAVG